MLRCTWLGGEAEVFSKEHWEGLTGSPFQSWDWQWNWWRSFGRGEPVALRVAEGTETIAYWTFVRSRGPLRVLTPLGVRGSDYLPPLMKAGADPWPALQEALAQAPGVDLVNLRRQPLGDAPVDLQPLEMSLSVELPSTWDAYAKRLGSSLRADIRKGAQYKITEGEEGLEHLFALHQARWRRRGMPGAFGLRVQKFHESLKLERSIYALWHQEKPIGALYALLGNNCTYFYQSGFDPNYASISPGTLLIARAIQDAIERGHHRFDMLRGNEPYKRRWKPDKEVAVGAKVIALTSVGKAAAPLFEMRNWLDKVAAERFEGKSLWQCLLGLPRSKVARSTPSVPHRGTPSPSSQGKDARLEACETHH